MPEDVKPRARALRCGTQLLAADALARCGPVEHAMGRAMGDQDIDLRRNQGKPSVKAAGTCRLSCVHRSRVAGRPADGAVTPHEARTLSDANTLPAMEHPLD